MGNQESSGKSVRIEIEVTPLEGNLEISTDI